MATGAIERLHYFQRQFLGAEDFNAQQQYHRDMRRRHNLAHHTWGIAAGLELIEKDAEGAAGGKDVVVRPGMAIDGYGREILVPEQVKLDPALFEAFAVQRHLSVWIAYTEEDAHKPRPGFEACDEQGNFERVREGFRFVVQPDGETHDPIVVAGDTVEPPSPGNTEELQSPPDESVPYQEFPDEETDPRWLVPLGSVNWNGVARRFEAANPPELLREGRRYIGLVAEDVFPSADLLRLHRRSLAVDDLEFVSVEGRLRVDRSLIAKADVFLHGGKLSFQATDGTDDSQPLWMQRLPATKELRVHIGEIGSTARLTIGPGPAAGGNEKPVLAVDARDNVEILTGTLHFGDQARQMLDLRNAEYAIGVQADTLYLRSASQFCWFRGGAHAANAGNPGAGGALQLRLDDAARLHFGSQTRQMLNLWSTLYGIGVQNGVEYFRTNNDFFWFKDGEHRDARGDPGNGTVQMKLDETGLLAVSGGLTTRSSVILGTGGNARLKVRHVDGKNNVNDNDDDLFLNWGTGRDVQIGQAGANPGSLIVTGNLTVNGSHNLFQMELGVMAVENQGEDNPFSWTYNYTKVYSEVYAA